MPADRQSEIRSLTKRKTSVRDITAKFTGSSLPETEQAFQAKIRKGKTVPSASVQELAAFTLTEKQRFIREYAVAIQSRDSGEEVSMESAVMFLRTNCSLTKQSCSNAESWQEWVEAIQGIVRSGSLSDERLDKSPIRFRSYESCSPPRSSLNVLSKSSLVSSNDACSGESSPLRQSSAVSNVPPTTSRDGSDSDGDGEVSARIEGSSEVDQWLSVSSAKVEIEERTRRGIAKEQAQLADEKRGDKQHDRDAPMTTSQSSPGTAIAGSNKDGNGLGNSSKTLGGNVTVRKAPRKNGQLVDADDRIGGSGGDDKENCRKDNTSEHGSMMKEKVTAGRGPQVNSGFDSNAEVRSNETPSHIKHSSTSSGSSSSSSDDDEATVNDSDSSGILSPDTPENALLTDRWTTPPPESPTDPSADNTTPHVCIPPKSSSKKSKAKHTPQHKIQGSGNFMRWLPAAGTFTTVMIAILAVMLAVYFVTAESRPSVVPTAAVGAKQAAVPIDIPHMPFLDADTANTKSIPSDVTTAITKATADRGNSESYRAENHPSRKKSSGLFGRVRARIDAWIIRFKNVKSPAIHSGHSQALSQ